MAKTTWKPIKTQIYIKSLEYTEQVKTCVLCDSVTNWYSGNIYLFIYLFIIQFIYADKSDIIANL